MRGQAHAAVIDNARRRPPATALSRGPLRARLLYDARLGNTRRKSNKAYRRLTSVDSDLEAFSRNPAGGSFAALAGRPAANTKYPNQWFLSY